MAGNPAMMVDPWGLVILRLGNWESAPHIERGFNLLLRTPSYKANFARYVTLRQNGKFEFAEHEFTENGDLSRSEKRYIVGEIGGLARASLPNSRASGRMEYVSYITFDQDPNKWEDQMSKNHTKLKLSGGYGDRELEIDVAIAILHEELHNGSFDAISEAFDNPAKARKEYEKGERNDFTGRKLHDQVINDNGLWRKTREQYTPELVGALMSKYPDLTQSQAQSAVINGFARHQAQIAGAEGVTQFTPLSSPLMPAKTSKSTPDAKTE